MIFPVGIEDARLRRIPFASALVVLLCLLVFAWQSTSPDDLVAVYGLVPARGLAQPGWITSLLLHSGLLHLLGNLLFFVFLSGPFVEDVWGSLTFGTFFIVAGVVAGAAQVGLDPSSTVPIIGASGAISASMGAFCVRFAKRRIGFAYFYMLVFKPRFGTFAAPAWVVGIFWLLQDLVSQLLTGGGDGVATMAHLGGMLFGAGVAAIFELTRFEERLGHPLDDTFRLGSDSPEHRREEARRLGVPVAALTPPSPADLSPPSWDLYDKARTAFAAGNSRMGSRRLRWLVEKGERPRDEGAMRHLLVRWSGVLDL